MSYQIKDNTPAVKAIFNQRGNIFLRLMTDQLTAISDPKTPKDKGNLRRDKVKSVSGLHAEIVWGKKYGIYQETKQYKNYTTPGTGPHFAENAAKKVIDYTGKIARQVGLA